MTLIKSHLHGKPRKNQITKDVREKAETDEGKEKTTITMTKIKV